MVQVAIVEKPEMNAIVVKVPRNGHEVRRGWRELQAQLGGIPGVRPGVGHVFIPEWQWAEGVKELWVGVEADTPGGVTLPAGLEALSLPARKYAVVHVYGNRDSMNRTYGELDAWFRTSGYVRDVQESSFGFESNGLEPVNPFEINADEIAWFDFHIHAPIASGPDEGGVSNTVSDAGGEHTLTLKNSSKPIQAQFSNISGSSFTCVNAERLHFENVNLSELSISDANLSDLEINGAQLGGAYIHSIGLPPVGHPAYDPYAVQRPLRFEDCDLNGSTFTRCKLVNVQLTDCDTTGLKINGVDISELLKLHGGR